MHTPIFIPFWGKLLHRAPLKKIFYTELAVRFNRQHHLCPPGISHVNRDECWISPKQASLFFFFCLWSKSFSLVRSKMMPAVGTKHEKKYCHIDWKTSREELQTHSKGSEVLI